jgi:HicB family
MSTFALRLPTSLYAHAKKLAERDQASMNQFVTVAVAEKVAALETAAFFYERAARGSSVSLQAILDRVPARSALAGDER